MLNITIDRQVRFDIPQGSFDATITGLKQFQKQTAKGRQDWVRLHLDVDVPGMRDYDCRAGRNFVLSLKAGTDLHNFLLPILGPDFFTLNSAKTIDLEAILVGKQVTATISHFAGEDYDTPLRVVDSIEVRKESV